MKIANKSSLSVGDFGSSVLDTYFDTELVMFSECFLFLTCTHITVVLFWSNLLYFAYVSITGDGVKRSASQLCSSLQKGYLLWDYFIRFEFLMVFTLHFVFFQVLTNRLIISAVYFPPFPLIMGCSCHQQLEKQYRGPSWTKKLVAFVLRQENAINIIHHDFCNAFHNMASDEQSEEDGD